MNNFYKVSVCVPIYGVEQYIERCAVSLFEQTYDNIEYIFVDDCTLDRSIEILKSVVDRYPERKPYVHIVKNGKNLGLGETRNRAVREASGDFVIHVDSDDWIEKRCIELCVRKHKETDADIVSMDILRIYRDKEVYVHIPEYSSTKDFILAIIEHTIPNNVWGRLIRRSIYTDNKIEVEAGVDFSEDLNVMPRLAYCANKVVTISRPMYFYERRNVNSYTSNFSDKMFGQSIKTFETLYSFFMNKSDCYKRAIDVRLYFSLVDYLINTGKSRKYKKMYYKIRKEIEAKPKYLKSKLSLPYRFAVYIKNYTLFGIYIRTVSVIKNIMK